MLDDGIFDQPAMLIGGIFDSCCVMLFEFTVLAIAETQPRGGASMSAF